LSITSFLHQFKPLRVAARVVAQKIDLQQDFYQGKIYLNAVDHSWAWTGEYRYQTFDDDLQNFIHQTSKGYDYFIDIGCNIGVMTIGTLFNNDTINAVAVDANTKTIGLLNKSLAYNQLSDRCRAVCKAIGNRNGHVKFDTEGSVTGHIADAGTEVEVVKLSEFLRPYSNSKAFVKIDIEGYELQLIEEFAQIENPKNFKFIVELHPLGYNGVGDPQNFIDELKKLNVCITGLQGGEITAVDIYNITQAILTF